ncbi:Serine/threonine-protein kinase SMG1 [Pelomyxa schiedti]|nr:Serine/threonine-protein kinase SMG1 [Pelomyxa schiedti]
MGGGVHLPASASGDEEEASRAVVQLCQVLMMTGGVDDVQKKIQVLGTLKGLVCSNPNVAQRNIDQILSTLTQALSDSKSDLVAAACNTTAAFAISLCLLLSNNVPSSVAPVSPSTSSTKKTIDWTVGKVFRWLFQHLNAQPPAPAPRLQMLTVLLQILDNVPNPVDSLKQLIMINVCSFLENMTEIEFLPLTVAVIQRLSHSFQTNFSLHFDDVVDILVGWEVDPDLPESTASVIEETLFKFGSLWAESHVFSLDLVSKFVIDIEAHIQGNLRGTGGPYVVLRFLSCFAAVVQGLGALFWQGANVVYIKKLVCALQHAIDKSTSETWLFKVNQTVNSLCQQSGNLLLEFYDETMKLLDKELIYCTLGSAQLRLVINILTLISKTLMDANPMGALLILQNEHIKKLRSHFSEEVLSALLDMLTLHLNSETTTSSLIVGQLLEDLSSCDPAEAVFIVVALSKCTSSTVHTTRIISSLSDVFLQQTCKTNLNTNLTLAHMKALRHLSTKVPHVPETLVAYNRLFESFVNLLLSSFGSPSSMTLESLEFIKDVLNSFSADTFTTKSPQIKKLLSAIIFTASHEDDLIREKSGMTLGLFIQVVCLENFERMAVAECALSRIGDFSSKVCQCFLLVLAVLAPTLAPPLEAPLYFSFPDPHLERLSTRELIRHPPKIELTALHFQQIFFHMLTVPNLPIEHPHHDIQKLLYACQTLCSLGVTNVLSSNKLKTAVDTFQSVCTFWSLWECARFCVNVRLKTPFGNANKISYRHLILLKKSLWNLPSNQSINLCTESPLPFSRGWNLWSNLKSISTMHMRGMLGEFNFLFPPTVSLFSVRTGKQLSQALDDAAHLLSSVGSLPIGFLSDFESCVLHYAIVSSSAQDSHSCKGLVSWVRKLREMGHLSLDLKHKLEFPWLQAYVLLSESHYEDAASIIQNFFKKPGSLNLFNPQTVTAMATQLSDIYAHLGEWDSFDMWQSEWENGHTGNVQTASVFTPTQCAWKYLDKADRGAALSALDITDCVVNVNPATPFHGQMEIMERLLLEAMLKKSSVPKSSSSCWAIAQSELGADLWTSLNDARSCLTHMWCVNAVTSAAQASFFPKTFTPNHDLLGLMKICRVVSFLKQDYTDFPPSPSHLWFALAKLSRKTGNLKLAKRALTKAISHSSNSMECEFERAKQVHAEGSGLLSALCTLWQLQQQETNITQVKIQIKLAKWLQEAEKNHSPQMILGMLTNTRNMDLSSGHTLPLPGVCLKQATLLDGNYLKSWLKYGNWCFECGTKRISQVLSSGEVCFTSDEIDKFSSLEKEFSMRHDLVSNLKDDLSQNIVTLLERSETLEEPADFYFEPQILELSSRYFPENSQAHSKIVDLCLAVRHRILEYYHYATECYFKALQIYSDPDSAIKATASVSIEAPLRILRLLVKYGNTLSLQLKAGFDNTPSSPWRHFIPQLMARLSHPVKQVRDQVLKLMCSIGKECPHLVVYSAVVGTVSLTPNQQSESSEEMQSILNYLNPLLVKEVRSLITELIRITNLWEEQWYFALHQASSGIVALGHALRELSATVQPNIDKRRLLRENYQNGIRTIIAPLETLLLKTSVTPETPHESNFQTVYIPLITKSLRQLSRPQDYNDMESNWQPLKEMMKDFNKLLQPSALHLEEISPALALLQSSSISMPGSSAHSESDIVTIHSFDKNAVILPSKTRPKKLTLVGSDGHRYSFLLKGREDLHLDERIMQFLNIVNQLFASDKHSLGGFRARDYAVIPLGASSGIIQWVEGAVPMFSVFKEWQRVQHRANPANVGQEPPRPGDIFYSKLIPALRENNVTNVMAREEWPLDIKRKVFNELVAETPKALLFKSMWCSCTTASEWWSKLCTYARSTAVMSVIGYIIGLGDRHLDNILVDFQSGELVHIDYNVCFEKGIKLRVPEMVPFRMTQNMVNALGFTELDGTFSESCRYVLGRLRSSSESLLDLLEAFVYDPLVDWTSDTEGDTTKEMEVNMNLHVFSSRVDEKKPFLRESKEKVSELLQNVKSSLSDRIDAQKTIQSLSLSKTRVESTQREHEAKMKLIDKEIAQDTELLLEAKQKYTAAQSVRDKLYPIELQSAINATTKLFESQELSFRSLLDDPQLNNPYEISPPINWNMSEAELSLIPEANRKSYSSVMSDLKTISQSLSHQSRQMALLIQQYRSNILACPSHYTKTYNLCGLWSSKLAELPLEGIPFPQLEKAVRESRVTSDTFLNFDLPIEARTEIEVISKQVKEEQQRMADLQAMKESHARTMSELAALRSSISHNENLKGAVVLLLYKIMDLLKNSPPSYDDNELATHFENCITTIESACAVLELLENSVKTKTISNLVSAHQLFSHMALFVTSIPALVAQIFALPNSARLSPLIAKLPATVIDQEIECQYKAALEIESLKELDFNVGLLNSVSSFIQPNFTSFKIQTVLSFLCNQHNHIGDRVKIIVDAFYLFIQEAALPVFIEELHSVIKRLMPSIESTDTLKVREVLTAGPSNVDIEKCYLQITQLVDLMKRTPNEEENQILEAQLLEGANNLQDLIQKQTSLYWLYDPHYVSVNSNETPHTRHDLIIQLGNLLASVERQLEAMDQAHKRQEKLEKAISKKLSAQPGSEQFHVVSCGHHKNACAVREQIKHIISLANKVLDLEHYCFLTETSSKYHSWHSNILGQLEDSLKSCTSLSGVITSLEAQLRDKKNLYNHLTEEKAVMELAISQQTTALESATLSEKALHKRLTESCRTLKQFLLQEDVEMKEIYNLLNSLLTTTVLEKCGKAYSSARVLLSRRKNCLETLNHFLSVVDTSPQALFNELDVNRIEKCKRDTSEYYRQLLSLAELASRGTRANQAQLPNATAVSQKVESDAVPSSAATSPPTTPPRSPVIDPTPAGVSLPSGRTFEAASPPTDDSQSSSDTREDNNQQLQETYDDSDSSSEPSPASFHIDTTPAPPKVPTRNTHALSVLKRIKAKLEGKDPVDTLTIEQQVKFIIEKATSTENLCQMYEGWTPWI